MKAILIADSDSSVTVLRDNLRPYGFDIIRYRSAIKALDNLEEIEPDAVFINTSDFPRHWKTLVQYIRSDTGKDETVIVLLTGERFGTEDADKAVHIGVQAIIGEEMDKSEDKEHLVEIFSRYRHIEGAEGSQNAKEAARNAVFLFTNPLNETIVTGKLERLGAREIRFRPDSPSLTADLAENETLGECSLKLGEDAIYPECRIKKNTNLMILEMINLKEDEQALLEKFIFGER